MVQSQSPSSSRVGSAELKSQSTHAGSRRITARTELRLDPAEHSTPATNFTAHHTLTTDRSGLEAELARRLAENLPQHAAVMLDPAGDVIHWNAGAERMFGFTSQELVGRSHTLLFASSDVHPQPEPLLPSESTAARRESEAIFIRRDGSTFPVRLTLVPADDAEFTNSFALLIHDVSERNRIENLLRSRFAETAHSARLSTVGQMVAELAHEINQPLAAAANYARACVNFGRSGQYVVAPEAIEWMERSAAQAMRAVTLSKRLGSFVRKHDGTPAWVQLNTMVRQSLSLAQPMLRGGDETLAPITVEFDLDPTAPEVVADPVQVEQVLLNLIRNATEAMHELKSRRHTLSIRTSLDAEFITISVGDTGPGIAPDKLAGLFDPFFTTKPTGLGLGLSISRSIVEQHGGRMTVESSPAGTTFSFTLPLPPGGQLPC